MEPIRASSCRPDDYPPHPPAGRRWRGRSYLTPPDRRSGLLGRFSGAQGQALVEFAIIVPVLLFMILAVAELAMLGSAKIRQDAATIEAARWAVANPDDAAPMPGLAGCAVTTGELDGYVTVASTCTYRPIALRGIWEGLPVSSEAAAALPGEVAAETSEPSVAP